MSIHTDSSSKSSIISYPSVSSALNLLPQATSLQDVSLHPNMYANRAAESEAKLQKALLKTPSHSLPQIQPMVYRVSSHTSSQDSSPQLTIRTKSKLASSDGESSCG